MPSHGPHPQQDPDIPLSLYALRVARRTSFTTSFAGVGARFYVPFLTITAMNPKHSPISSGLSIYLSNMNLEELGDARHTEFRILAFSAIGR
jgi:hypothetical protein